MYNIMVDTYNRIKSITKRKVSPVRYKVEPIEGIKNSTKVISNKKEGSLDVYA